MIQKLLCEYMNLQNGGTSKTPPFLVKYRPEYKALQSYKSRKKMINTARKSI